MLVYTCGKSTCRLITDLVSQKYPAEDLAHLYHERWEQELVHDELKNHFAVGLHGSQDLCVRSKLAEGVLQELYGLFTAYNIVRDLIADAAEHHNIKPQNISFTDALVAFQLMVPSLVPATDEQGQALIHRFMSDVAKACRLRPRRNRQYPRKVKIKMSDFGCKTAEDVQQKANLAPHLTEYTPTQPWSRKKREAPLKQAGDQAAGSPE